MMKANIGMKVPRSLLYLAGLTTAALTVWVLMGKGNPPAWLSRLTSTAGVGLTATESASPAQAAYQPQQGPPIRAGQQATHAELGPCTLCHSVQGRGSRPLPAISASARIPHQYQGGVCINCHRIGAGLHNSVQQAPATLSSRSAQQTLLGQAQQPATRWAANGSQSAQVQAQPAQVQAPPPQQQVTPPTSLPQLPTLSIARPEPASVQWLGLTLVELTPDAAERLGLSRELKGLLITAAQGEAAALGMKSGDVLIGVNRQLVGEIKRLRELTNLETSQVAELQILREGSLFRVPLRQAEQREAAPPAKQRLSGAAAQPAPAGAQASSLGSTALAAGAGSTTQAAPEPLPGRLTGLKERELERER